jgi:ubiquinone/menaquinone biosynthesis C-methylase UbiE
MSTRFARRIISLAEIHKGSKVLDLGCGPGLISKEIARVIGEEGSLVALDMSEEMVKIAKGRLGKSENISVILGDASNLMSFVKARFFTNVVASDVWHQLGDRRKVLLQVKESMEDNGVLCIADHMEIREGSLAQYVSKRKELNSILLQRLGVASDRVGKPTATRRELETYKEEMRKSGFEILKIDEDENLADVNDMLLLLPKIVSSEICESYPALNRSKVEKASNEAFMKVFGARASLKPIGTEAFIVAKLQYGIS